MPRGMIETFKTGSTPGKLARPAHGQFRDRRRGGAPGASKSGSSFQVRRRCVRARPSHPRKSLAHCCGGSRRRCLVHKIGEIGASEARLMAAMRSRSTFGSRMILCTCTFKISSRHCVRVDRQAPAVETAHEARRVENFGRFVAASNMTPVEGRNRRARRGAD